MTTAPTDITGPATQRGSLDPSAAGGSQRLECSVTTRVQGRIPAPSVLGRGSGSAGSGDDCGHMDFARNPVVVQASMTSPRPRHWASSELCAVRMQRLCVHVLVLRPRSVPRVAQLSVVLSSESPSISQLWSTTQSSQQLNLADSSNAASPAPTVPPALCTSSPCESPPPLPRPAPLPLFGSTRCPRALQPDWSARSCLID